ncbi:MAG: PASTA domain-containing protein [Candidatus Poribacteria bacterium]|nr:PASTA domain-containing protein [Candidatus Poribacteria bacterium]
MNSLNNTLFASFKVFLYLLIFLGIIGALAIFVVIPGWVRTEEVLVPNITGESYYEAVRILGDAGLQPAKTIQEASSDAPKGEIVSQNPEANFRIKSYQPVEITVSIGAELVPVPSVIGKSRDAAFESLASVGFRPNRVAFVHSEDYLQDTVIAQTPPEGGGQRRGSPVNLLVSRGTRPQVVQLPNFQSQLAADVVAVLEAVGLKVETEYSSHPKIPQGAIITHEPAGGVMVKTGDRVLIEISGVQGATEDISRPLTFTHTVSEEGKLSRHVKIVIIDEYSERIEIDQRYAPGTVIDLEQKGVRVFGKARVIVYENDEKLPEVVYR